MNTKRGSARRKQDWPECIPWTEPTEEYAPGAWRSPTHDNPTGVDDYPASHVAAGSVGDSYLGDVCPYCGVPLSWDEDVVTIDGDSGPFYTVNELRKPVAAYHPGCWRDRQAEVHGQRNALLTEF